MKKLLLALGSIAAVAAPVASVVACGAPKQKHVKLDVDKIEALVPDLTTAVEEAMNKTDGLKDASHTVVADGDNFKVTFTDRGTNVELEVTPDGAVTSFKMPGQDGALIDAAPAQLAAVQKVMEGGTIDHSGDSTEEIKLDKTKFDDAVIAKASLTFPVALPTGATNADVKAQNKAVQTFQDAYEQAVADQAAEFFNGIKTLGITRDDFTNNVGILSDANFDDTLIGKFGFESADEAKLRKFLDDGAEFHIELPTAGFDINGMVLKNGKQATLDLKATNIAFKA